MKPVLTLILSLSILPTLYGMSVAGANDINRFETETLDLNSFECTTDLDCECDVVPYEAPNNSPKCIEYRNESLQAKAGAR